MVQIGKFNSTKMRILGTVKLIISVGIFLLASCKKQETPTNIVVNVNLIDENEYVITNNSGINITLSDGQENFMGVTGSNGECTFNNLPYGTFNVKFEKSGFISEYINPVLSHNENDSINFHSYKMLEIPNFEISLDSINRKSKVGDNSRLYGYGKLHNTKGLPKIQYETIVYFSNNINVSKDNYLFYHFGAVMIFYINGNNCQIWMSNPLISYLVPPGYDTLYVRVYARAAHPEWLDIREEAFGVPSDVYKWVIPK